MDIDYVLLDTKKVKVSKRFTVKGRSVEPHELRLRDYWAFLMVKETRRERAVRGEMMNQDPATFLDFYSEVFESEHYDAISVLSNFSFYIKWLVLFFLLYFTVIDLIHLITLGPLMIRKQKLHTARMLYGAMTDALEEVPIKLAPHK